MTTRPGSTLFTTSCTSTVPLVPLPDGDLKGEGTAPAPGRAVVVAAVVAGWSTATVTPTAAPAATTATARNASGRVARRGLRDDPELPSLA
jgi:hypothetical protein